MRGLLVAQSMHGQEVVMAGGDLVFIPFDSSGRRTVGEVSGQGLSVPRLSIASLSVACLCVRCLFRSSRAPLALLSLLSLARTRLPLISRVLVSLSLGCTSSLSSLLFKSLLFALSSILLVRACRLVACQLAGELAADQLPLLHVTPHACHFPPALPPHLAGMAWPSMAYLSLSWPSMAYQASAEYGIPRLVLLYRPIRAPASHYAAITAVCVVWQVSGL